MALTRIFAGLSNEVLIAVGGTTMLLLTILVIYITCWEEPHSQPYRFRHDSPAPVPGSKSTFTSTDTFVSTRTNTILRTYHTPPQPRAGNGMATPTRPRAVLVWSASVGQHSTRYAHVAQHIAPLGYAMCALDHSGTGESAGPRGRMSRFEDHVADLIQYAEHVQNMYPGIPMFVGGQACGACLAICAALDAPQLFRGMILLAPALHSTLHPYLRSIVPILSHIVPSLPLATVAPADQYSRNPNVATSLSRDPLLPKGRLTASTAAEILRLMSHVNAQLPHISIPYLVQHGLRDMICCPTGTRRLVTETTRVRPHHKTLVALPRCWHDLLHEPEYDEVIGHIVDWLDEQIRVAELVKTLD